MNDYIIENARPEDAAAILEYLKIVGGETDNLNMGAEGIPIAVEVEEAFLRSMLDSSDDVMYAAKADGEIIGIANVSRLKRRMSHRASIGISVRQCAWHCGVGTALLVTGRIVLTPGAKQPLELNADSIAEAHSVLSRYLTDEKIASLYAGNVVRFHEGKELGAAVYYPDNEGNFIVLVVSSNQYGGDIQHRIGWLLLGMLVISAVLVYFVGRLYATRMVDRIDAAYQSEKSFISNASHELNNPLTAIQGECEISLLKERTSAEYQAALGRIASETKRIILLMKNLLFLSHGDKEILKNARETVLLADFLMQFVGNRVRFTTDHFAFAIEANPHLLKIAIGNILNNACKYSGEAPVEMQLKGSVLTITDMGIGIPEEEIARVYQPFYRASNTREFAGHGIGLSLSMRILRSYGAEITITSEVGKGTTVEIEFP